MHINNLYKCQDILMLKECYALEKIHGTSANIQWSKGTLNFHSGGESHERFKALFAAEAISKRMIDLGYATRDVIIYGEAYGGRCQGMSGTYGKELKFAAFDVFVDEKQWLSVPDAEAFCSGFNIEFVAYVEISTDLKEIDAQRDAPSVQAVRNGITEPRKREGVVLRPLVELTNSYGNRVMSKHKGDEFRETASPRVVEDPAKLKIMTDAQNIANEYVTMMRLEHVLDKIEGHCMEKMQVIIAAMVEDVTREAAGEIVLSDAVTKTIRSKTAMMYKEYLKSKLV